MKKVEQRLIAWNFASTLVHQRASRKFPRRYLSGTEGLCGQPTGPELGVNGLRGYGSSEQQSIGSTVESTTYQAD